MLLQLECHNCVRPKASNLSASDLELESLGDSVSNSSQLFETVLDSVRSRLRAANILAGPEGFGRYNPSFPGPNIADCLGSDAVLGCKARGSLGRLAPLHLEDRNRIGPCQPAAGTVVTMETGSLGGLDG